MQQAVDVAINKNMWQSTSIVINRTSEKPSWVNHKSCLCDICQCTVQFNIVSIIYQKDDTLLYHFEVYIITYHYMPLKVYHTSNKTFKQEHWQQRII